MWPPAPRSIIALTLVAPACLIGVRLAAGSGTAAGSWSAAVNLSAPGASVQQASLAIGANGAAVAVWQRVGGERSTIQAAARPAAGAWEPEASVTPSAAAVMNPRVAVDRRGTAIAVWDSYDDRAYVVQASVRPAGGAWQSAVDVSGRSRHEGLPRVGVDAGGNAVAVWTRRAGGVATVQAARRPTRGAWRRPVDLVRERAAKRAGYSEAQIAVDPGGDAVAVWTRVVSRPGSGMPRSQRVQAAAAPAGRRWRAPETLSAAGRFAGAPNVAIDARGVAVAVWERFAPELASTAVVQSATRAAGRWSVPVAISPAGGASAPRIGLAADGTAIAMWQRARLDGSSRLFSAMRPPGGAWRSPAAVSPDGEVAYGTALGVDARGNAFAAWHRGLELDERTERTTTVVRAARLVAGRGWQAPVDLSGIAPQDSEAEIAIGPDGGAVALWTRVVDGATLVQAAAGSGS